MNLDDDKRRAPIAGAVTLLIHAVIFLVPISVKIATNHNIDLVEAKGYYTSLVDLSGSPDGQPGVGIPGSGHEGGGSTVTIAESKKETKKDSEVKAVKAKTEGHSKINSAESFGPTNQDPKNSAPVTATPNSKNGAVKADAKGGKDNIPAVSGEKGGAGSGSGNGIGSGIGSGTGKGQGSGSGSGSGAGDNPGPGSGPPRKGLGIGQGNVSLGPPPVYPKNAQNNGVIGKNRYHIVVGSDGKIKVTCLQPSGDQSLDNSAVRTLISRWKYPALESAYYFEVEFVFTMDSSVAKVFYIKEGWEDGKP